MKSQPEALRLADELECGTYLLSVERDTTAAELRRLNDVNRELVEALQEVCFQLLARRVSTDPDHPDNFYIRAAEAAIAKAKGGQL